MLKEQLQRRGTWGWVGSEYEVVLMQVFQPHRKRALESACLRVFIYKCIDIG